MFEVLVRIRRRYERNIFTFFFMHPTYLFAIWLILQTQMSVASIALLFLKTVDIATKIVLMQQIFEKKEITPQLHDMLTARLEPWMPYIGLAVYVPLVALALA